MKFEVEITTGNLYIKLHTLLQILTCICARSFQYMHGMYAPTESIKYLECCYQLPHKNAVIKNYKVVS